MNARKLILTLVLLGGIVLVNEAMAVNLKVTKNAKYFNVSGELVASGEVYSVYGENYSPLAKQGDGFITFCLEKKSTFFENTLYNAEIREYAANGGNNANPEIPGQDPISQGTAYLYSLFASGNLTGYDYDNSEGKRLFDAQALQNAIWGLEDEISMPSNNKFIELVTSVLGDVNTAKTNNDNKYGAAVMNLKSIYWYGNWRFIEAQDMLVYVRVATPDGGLTMAMLGFGLAGLSAVGRRFRKS